MQQQRSSALAVTFLLLGACAGEAPAPWPGQAGSQPPGVAAIGEPANEEVRLMVPTDERAAVLASTRPPPISGGTLLVSADGRYAFVADPDRDRLSIVDIVQTEGAEVLHTLALWPGDEPGRMAEDDLGRVHVVARGGGAVISVDAASGDVRARHEICGAPRGIAFEPTARALHVACAGGELITLSPDTGEVQRRVDLGVDLRDVMVQGDRLLVTRFKQAELLELDADGAIVSRARPEPARDVTLSVDRGSEPQVHTLESHVAWRSLAYEGGVLMLHQGARQGVIELSAAEGESEPNLDSFAVQSSAYGGSGGVADCTGVVQSRLTQLGGVDRFGRSVRLGATLAVDMAVSPVNGKLAVVQAGTRDPDQPMPALVVPGASDEHALLSTRPGPSSSVQVFGQDAPSIADDPGETPCLLDLEGIQIRGQAVAVAYTPAGTLLVQNRQPAQLLFYVAGGRAPRYAVQLGGDSVYDTGHEIFHRDPGGGVACASCHVEGGDDGHTWEFSTFGLRRTQSVNVGLAGTAPFHWQGDMHDLSTLMEEVLVGRMGGVHQSQGRTQALQSWLFELQPPPPPRRGDDPAAVRGRVLFDGQAQCSTCHSGAKLTDNATVDVGTGEPLQVPSLVGIAYRAPFMHSGCAATLRDRFDPNCGGAQHGNASDLAPEQLDDLIAYLESL